MMQRQAPPPYRIHCFALCYLMTMVSYAAITTMMYSLYDRNGLTTLALVDGIFAFLGFGPTNMVVLTILRKFNLKKSLALGFTGLFLFNLIVLMTIAVIENQTPVLSYLPVLYLLNIISSTLAGISNSIIWTIMPLYIQSHCDQLEPFNQLENPDKEQNKNSLTANMGLFWSICLFSNIVGGLINIFVLGFANQYAYMLVICVISGLSILMVVILVQPFKIPQNGYDVQKQSVKVAVQKQLRNLLNILKNEKQNGLGFPNIFIFNFVAGLFLSFNLIFINKIIKQSLPEDTSSQQFNRLTAIVFICQGLGSISMGLTQNKLYFLISQNKQKLLMAALIALQIAMLLTVSSYNVLEHTGNGYWVCILVAVWWAGTQTHIKTNQEAYIRQYNGGKVEYYSLSILFYSAGSILNYIIQIIENPNTQILVLMVCGVICITIWLVREPSIEYLNAKASLLKSENQSTESPHEQCSNPQTFDIN